jgi:hypothetical protein
VSGNVFCTKRQNFAFHGSAREKTRKSKQALLNARFEYSFLIAPCTQCAIYVVIKCLLLFISVGIASEAKDWYGWQQLK